MIVLVPLVTLVVWQDHPSKAILINDRRILSEINLNVIKLVNL